MRSAREGSLKDRKLLKPSPTLLLLQRVMMLRRQNTENAISILFQEDGYGCVVVGLNRHSNTYASYLSYSKAKRLTLLNLFTTIRSCRSDKYGEPVLSLLESPQPQNRADGCLGYAG